MPLAAGGTTDLVGRVVADILAKATGQAFTIENRTGGGGNVGAELVARAAPDGRTLLLGHVGTAVTNQYLFKYLPYDSDSFAPVALVGEVANVLVVHPGFHCHSFPEFITWCQAQRPFKESYASPAIGSVGHLAMESLQAMLGIKLSHMAYRSRSLMFRELLAGRVQMAMDNLPGYLSPIRSGALRALAVSSAGRWFAAPDIPAVSEHGFGDYTATLWWYVAAPAGTRIALVQSLSDAIVDGLAGALHGGQDARHRRDGNATLRSGSCHPHRRRKRPVEEGDYRSRDRATISSGRPAETRGTSSMLHSGHVETTLRPRASRPSGQR